MQAAVERVIANMWDRYDEPLSLEDMAGVAFFSRFYFSRVFRSITGTSPGRFLTAIRLYKAKNLLLETTMSVTDISYQVGYNSPGTFSSRFTRSVGIPPARYRYLSEAGIPAPQRRTVPGHHLGRVRGSLTCPEAGVPIRVYVSLLESIIPQGTPVACSVLDGEGTYDLTGVPDGQWFLHATAVAVHNLDPRPWMRRPVFLSTSRPVTTVAGRVTTTRIELRPPRLIDPPVLFTLPELDSRVPVTAAVRAASPVTGWQRPSVLDEVDSSRAWADSARVVVG